MKKIIIGMLIGAAVLGMAYFFYKQVDTVPYLPIFTAENDALISTFFTYAQEQIPKITKEIEVLEKNPEENQKAILEKRNTLKLFKIVDMIARRDVAALKKTDAQDLSFNENQIWVKGDRFDPVPFGFDKNLFQSAILASQNALGLALFNSVRDKNASDKSQTLDMVKILLEKKLDPNTLAGFAFFVKDKSDAKEAFDYVNNSSLTSMVVDWSYPEALKLLLKYGATFNKNAIPKIIARSKRSDIGQFKKLFDQYATQAIVPEGLDWESMGLSGE